MNMATEKQIGYIASLVGGRFESDAYRAIGKHFGISASSAQRRTTKQMASEVIDSLKKK
jgi:hypothetical protein